MKKLLLLLFLFPILLQAQTKTTYNVTYDGVQRTFIQYVPSTYNGSVAVPVLFSLHGLGDVASNFSNVGFEQLAEVHNFIVITPQAVNAAGFGTAWNSGAGIGPLVLNGSIDDVGFISVLLDSTINHYNVDASRVYSTGFSMGSFMSNRLACELNDRIAAVASVAGAIGNAITGTCSPERSVPFCHFHGTADGTVSYSNNTFGTNAEETVAFWEDNANCSGLPDSVAIADTKNDGITIKHYIYNNCDVDVEFYKATGAGHVWLNASQNDISYTQAIWEFLSRQSNPAAVSCSSLSVDLGEDQEVIDGQTVVLDATTDDATYSWQDGSQSATFSVTLPGIYWVDVTVGNCTARDSVVIDFVTTLFTNSNAFDFSVYPNPMSERGVISINALQSSMLAINVIDMIGRQVFGKSVEVSVGENSIPFELNNVAKGTYILNLEMNGEKSSQPFIVK
ncbi:MAG: T9SS type A sorting domain-containing protein [Chitinophagales bacterium]